MELLELKKWLRENSSGIYRPAAEAADRLERMEAALKQLSECNLHDGNCASFDVANRRIRNLALRALS